jgi:hypothetical protein
MSTWSEMETKASGLLCPDCGTCSVSLHLRCDIQAPECLTVATCRHCNRQFEADSISTYTERYETSLETANAPCPACGAPQRVLCWVCNRSDKTCHMLLACEGCGEAQAA